MLATVLTHLLLLSRAVGPDEGGFSVVAAHWKEAGPYLYGPLWVDRPPGLIALFWVADQMGPWGVRSVASILAVALVLLVARTASAVGGHPGWAAWTAYALGSSVLLQGQQLNGEYAAVVCVSAAMLAVVHAVNRRTRSAFLLGVAAGVAAATAIFMKQNFLDGFVFAAVLCTVTAMVVPRQRRIAGRVMAGMALGASAVVGTAVVWTQSHHGLRALLWAMYGFRARAMEVMGQGSWAAPDRRLALLVGLCVASGLLVLAAWLLAHGGPALRNRNPLAWALTAVGLFDVVSVVAGANFWPHYVLAFIPVIAVSAGLGARRGQPGWLWTRRIVTTAVLGTALISPAAALVMGPGEAWEIGQWVQRSARRSDTIVVPYTHPNVVASSALRPAYPYLWSLPVRVNDPELATLTRRLNQPDGATWVVFFNRASTWHLDHAGQLDRVLRAHYTKVAHVCGHSVWLRAHLTRTLAPLPTNCAGGAL